MVRFIRNCDPVLGSPHLSSCQFLQFYKIKVIRPQPKELRVFLSKATFERTLDLLMIYHDINSRSLLIFKRFWMMMNADEMFPRFPQTLTRSTRLSRKGPSQGKTPPSRVAQRRFQNVQPACYDFRAPDFTNFTVFFCFFKRFLRIFLHELFLVCFWREGTGRRKVEEEDRRDLDPWMFLLNRFQESRLSTSPCLSLPCLLPKDITF